MDFFGKDDLTDAELLASHGIFANNEKQSDKAPALNYTPSTAPRPSLSHLTGLVSGSDQELDVEESPK